MRTIKKAHIVTLFILLVIVLMFSLGLMGYYISHLKIGQIELRTDELKILSQYTNECLEKVSNEALYLSVRQGGFIWPESTLETPFGQTSLDIAPVKTAEKQISKYVNDNLPACLKEYKFLKDKDINLIRGSINTKTTLAENNVNIIVEMPVKLKDEKSKVQIEQFTTSANVRLKQLIEHAQNMMRYDKVWLSYLESLDINTTIIKKDSFMIYIFEDDKSTIKDTNYLFMFAKEVED